jgi:hypothetical protein
MDNLERVAKSVWDELGILPWEVKVAVIVVVVAAGMVLLPEA